MTGFVSLLSVFGIYDSMVGLLIVVLTQFVTLLIQLSYCLVDVRLVFVLVIMICYCAS
jgi:hypothetical protein